MAAASRSEHWAHEYVCNNSKDRESFKKVWATEKFHNPDKWCQSHWLHADTQSQQLGETHAALEHSIIKNHVYKGQWFCFRRNIGQVTQKITHLYHARKHAWDLNIPKIINSTLKTKSLVQVYSHLWTGRVVERLVQWRACTAWSPTMWSFRKILVACSPGIGRPPPFQWGVHSHLYRHIHW